MQFLLETLQQDILRQ